MKLVSWMRWQDGDTELKLLETATELHILIINSGIDQPVAAYERGQIRSILDAHSTATCTFQVHADDSTTQQFHCYPEDCTPLLAKLRKFQGTNPEAKLPEDQLLSGDLHQITGP